MKKVQRKLNFTNAINYCVFFTFHLSTLLSIVSASAQEDYAIDKIEFIGNRTFASGDLLAQMTSYSASKFQRIILRKRPFLFDEKVLQADLNRLKKFYQSEGFLNVQTSDSLKTNRNQTSIAIIIKISEGEPIMVRDVSFNIKSEDNIPEGKSPPTIIKKLQPVLSLNKGDRFRDKLLRADQDKILNQFSNEGYPYIQARPELSLDKENNTVTIVYHINPGLKCFFGDVSLYQNLKTPGSVIRKQLAFKRGQLFKQHLIEKSQRQVYQSGFFQSVSVKALLNNQENPIIPVQIFVNEAPRQTVKFGLGYGIEDNFRWFIDIRRLGFLGGARRLNLYMKHSKLEPYNINLKFTQPAFITPNTTLLLTSFVVREDEPGYELRRIGATLTLEKQFTSITSGYMSYILEQDNQDLNAASRILILDYSNKSLYNKATLKIGLVRDSSGPIFSPIHGTFRALTYTLSGLGFRSQFNFTRVNLEIRNYHQINRAFILASKFKLGALKPISGDNITPIEERFFAGGSMSVRGWARSQLGPKNSDQDPSGGNSLLEGNAEIRYPIWKLITGATFIDVGNVWNKSFHYQLDELRYAAGFGLRIDTPVGPIRVDVARPIFDKEKSVQIHLNVGQAF